MDSEVAVAHPTDCNEDVVAGIEGATIGPSRLDAGVGVESAGWVRKSAEAGRLGHPDRLRDLVVAGRVVNASGRRGGRSRRCRVRATGFGIDGDRQRA
jgi:hypothetical protein